MKVADVIALLVERFPKSFVILEKHRQPLKLRIHADILALSDAVTAADLANALRVYCSAIPYLDKLRTGAVRIGLDGEPAGVVTKGEADHAHVVWKKAVRRKAARKVERERMAEEAAKEAAEQERAAKRVLAHRPTLKLRHGAAVRTVRNAASGRVPPPHRGGPRP